jgi:hypothetical protein
VKPGFLGDQIHHLWRTIIYGFIPLTLREKSQQAAVLIDGKDSEDRG